MKLSEYVIEELNRDIINKVCNEIIKRAEDKRDVIIKYEMDSSDEQKFKEQFEKVKNLGDASYNIYNMSIEEIDALIGAGTVRRSVQHVIDKYTKK